MNDEKAKKERSYLPRSWGSIAARESKEPASQDSFFEPAPQSQCAPEAASNEQLTYNPDTDTELSEDFRSNDSFLEPIAAADSVNAISDNGLEDIPEPELYQTASCARAENPDSSVLSEPDDDPAPENFEVDDSFEENSEASDDACVTTAAEKTELIIVKVVGIRFGYACKIYHFEASVPDLNAEDWVVVKTEKGLGLGQIAVGPFDKEFDPSQLELLRKIIRKASKADFDQKTRCSQKEMEAYNYCLDKIEALDLSMKLIAVECFFDTSKYVFYFTAEGRVDFRELVKQLVARFPVRIEMRQIGVRHEAKMTGGLACCGQELCCSRFLVDFRPVSVKMAKNQNLSLNPTKISGVCGRLMCCLSYEHDTYESFKKDLPRIGKAIKTTKGDGVVIKLNPIAETVFVRIDEDQTIEVTKEEILNGAAKSVKQPQESGRTNEP